MNMRKVWDTWKEEMTLRHDFFQELLGYLQNAGLFRCLKRALSEHL